MSFTENLQYLRKQKNITQEQLAEQLEVSRQSVSKWESGTTYPEMEKILQICEMFHCNMDTLMQGDISKSYAQDAYGYDKVQNTFSKMVTAGIGLILIGLSAMFLWMGSGLPEDFGTVVFFGFLVVAVMLFVIMGMQSEQFKKRHPVIEDFYTEQQKEKADAAFTVRMVVGIGLIMLDIFAIITTFSILESKESLYDAITMEKMENLVMSGFFLIMAAAVTTLVYGGVQKSKYEISVYNKEGNPSPTKKKQDSLIGKICGCIFMVATIIFLLWSFLTGSWSISWIVYVVAAILCGIVSVVISKEE